MLSVPMFRLDRSASDLWSDVFKAKLTPEKWLACHVPVGQADRMPEQAPLLPDLMSILIVLIAP